jgi:putative transposase
MRGHAYRTIQLSITCSLTCIGFMSTYLPRRKSPRLANYDYSLSRAYFVTICSYQRISLFGEISESEMQLNSVGEIAAECWVAITEHFPQVALDLWVVMPNHMHGILVLDNDDPHYKHVKKTTLGNVINTYKGAVTRKLRQLDVLSEPRVWQGRYHDHIIRDERGLNALREYVLYNPARWEKDKFYNSG